MKKNFDFLFEQRNIFTEIKRIDCKKLFIYILIIISFLVLSIFVDGKIGLNHSFFFSMYWISIFIIFIYISKNKGKVYSIFYFIFLIFSIIQYFHINIINEPFGISEIFNFKEALDYNNAIIENINIKFILYLFVSILNYIIVYKLIKKNLTQNNSNKLITLMFFIPIIIIYKLLLIVSIGINYNGYNIFESNLNKRRIYDTFINKEEAYNLTDLYEYTIRDMYLFIKPYFEIDKYKNKILIDEYFKTNDTSHIKNDYTGIFKDKNVIVILAESIDTWLITEDIMPTVYNMQKNSINFINRYSPFYGSGRTFNTEYSLNTGLYIPMNYNIYDTENHNYQYSLPNMFIKNGYITNSLHFNSGDFYDRKNMHNSFGYQNRYFLNDIYEEDYSNDPDIFKNKDIYNSVVNKEDKFLTFFITYSAHLPYNNSNPLCRKINNENECIKTLAGYTDEAIRILVESLKQDNLLEDTVIVFVTDHYTYGYNKEEVYSLKGGDTNIYVDKVPFFIWNNNNYSMTIDKYVDTSDILPTLLNLFGIEYGNTYLGTDALGLNHQDYVYFNDGNLIGNTSISSEQIFKKININDLIVKTDYYK